MNTFDKQKHKHMQRQRRHENAYIDFSRSECVCVALASETTTLNGKFIFFYSSKLCSIIGLESFFASSQMQPADRGEYHLLGFY